MMTVVCRPKRMRRIKALAGKGLPTMWRWTSDGTRYLGSAKPGRGGRRKRKADRAKIRAHIGRGVERKGWPLLWELRILLLSKMPTRLTRKLALAPLLMPPAGLRARLEQRTPGRRERRRRTKLRRRRARCEALKAARAFLMALPAFYGRPTHRDVSRIAQRKIEQLRCRTSPTPGA